MALTRTECPECGAGLKLPVGFRPGRTICCPKCETYFVVEEGDDPPPPPRKPRPAAAPAPVGKKSVRAAADDEDEDDRPRKAKKKKKAAAADDEEEWSYSNSWIRYAVLAVLLAVLGVLGYMLYEKQQREKKDKDAARNDPPEGQQQAKVVPDASAPGANGVPLAKGLQLEPVTVKLNPASKKGPPDAAALTEEVRKRLVGRWEYREQEGEVYTIEYRADGSFSYTADLAGKEEKVAGRWKTGPARQVQFVGAKPGQLAVGFDVEWAADAGPVKTGSAFFEPDGSLYQNLLGRLLYDTPGPTAGKFVRK